MRGDGTGGMVVGDCGGSVKCVVVHGIGEWVGREEDGVAVLVGVGGGDHLAVLVRL